MKKVFLFIVLVFGLTPLLFGYPIRLEENVLNNINENQNTGTEVFPATSEQSPLAGIPSSNNELTGFNTTVSRSDGWLFEDGKDQKTPIGSGYYVLLVLSGVYLFYTRRKMRLKDS